MAERGNASLRALDQRVGPWLLAGQALTRRKRPMPTDPRRIGLLCVGALGDLLLFSSILPALKRHYPQATFVTFGSSTNAAIAAMLDLGDFVTLPLSRPDRAARLMRAEGCDLLIDSTQWANIPAILAAFSGAHLIGFETALSARNRIYDQRAPHSNAIHEIENFRNLARLAGAALFAPPVIHLTEAHRAAATALVSGDYAVIHAWPAGKRAELKAWPNANWAAVARHLAGKGLRVALTGAPADLGNANALEAAIGDGAEVINTAGKLRLPETAALLAESRLTLSVNTGIMHMAAVFDVPLIGLHGPTNPRRWGPVSDRAIDLLPACEGCGYLNLGFEYPDMPPDCMGAITPEAAMAAIDKALS